MSEVHLADRFAESICDTWRYCKVLRRWFRRVGLHWHEDRKREIDSLAVRLTRQAITWPEAQNLDANEKRWVCSKRTAGNVRDLTAADPRIAVIPEELGYVSPKPSMCGIQWNRARLAIPPARARAPEYAEQAPAHDARGSL